jgi:hypothetical protein
MSTILLLFGAFLGIAWSLTLATAISDYLTGRGA